MPKDWLAKILCKVFAAFSVFIFVAGLLWMFALMQAAPNGENRPLVVLIVAFAIFVSTGLMVAAMAMAEIADKPMED